MRVTILAPVVRAQNVRKTNKTQMQPSTPPEEWEKNPGVWLVGLGSHCPPLSQANHAERTGDRAKALLDMYIKYEYICWLRLSVVPTLVSYDCSLPYHRIGSISCCGGSLWETRLSLLYTMLLYYSLGNLRVIFLWRPNNKSWWGDLLALSIVTITSHPAPTIEQDSSVAPLEPSPNICIFLEDTATCVVPEPTLSCLTHSIVFTGRIVYFFTRDLFF